MEEAEADLTAYRDNPRLMRTLGEDRFEAGIARRCKRVERALLELAAARRANDDPGLDDPSDLEAKWPALSADERRDFLGQVIDCLFVRGQGGAATGRVYVCLRGEEPVDLPHRGGHRGAGIRGFEWPKRPRAANRLHEPRQWSERRIREQLTEFLEVREQWPAYEEFQAAGRARLWRQLMGYGGPWFWARELDVKITNRYLVPRWNSERLRAALAPFLRRYDYWPSQGEFEAAGLSALRKAVHSHGGAKHWAAEFGLPLRDHRQGPVPYWTEQRVEAELRELCAGATSYPTPSDFRKADRWRLYAAIDKRWGHSHWAERLGLPRARPWRVRPRRRGQI